MSKIDPILLPAELTFDRVGSRCYSILADKPFVKKTGVAVPEKIRILLVDPAAEMLRLLGMALSGVGLGGFLVPALRWSIVQYGWRTAAFGVGLVAWVVCMPIALVMRRRPEHYGYLPDGDMEPAVIGHKTEEPVFAAREALRTRAFWLMSVAFSLRVLITGAVALHLIPFLLDIDECVEV